MEETSPAHVFLPRILTMKKPAQYARFHRIAVTKDTARHASGDHGFSVRFFSLDPSLSSLTAPPDAPSTINRAHAAMKTQ